MLRCQFKKLFDVLEYRVKHGGEKGPTYLLGYAEGLGNGKLTGYQFGALVHLFLSPDANGDSINKSVQVLPAEDEIENADFDYLKKLPQ